MEAPALPVGDGNRTLKLVPVPLEKVVDPLRHDHVVV